MDLTDSIKTLLITTAKALQGSARRLLPAPSKNLVQADNSVLRANWAGAA
ncbi:MAG: hypothetical protein ABIV47_12980 [Roseiflexaceae bacterium]